MGWLRVGRVKDGVGDSGVLGVPLIIISPPHPQFRDNLQDLLPTMPKADDYFLLRWLRGEAGGIGGSQERVWEALGYSSQGGKEQGSGISLLWAGI